MQSFLRNGAPTAGPIQLYALARHGDQRQGIPASDGHVPSILAPDPTVPTSHSQEKLCLLFHLRAGYP